MRELWRFRSNSRAVRLASLSNGARGRGSEGRGRKRRHAQRRHALQRVREVNGQRLFEHTNHQREIRLQTPRRQCQIYIPCIVVGGQNQHRSGAQNIGTDLNRVGAREIELDHLTARFRQTLPDGGRQAIVAVQQHTDRAHCARSLRL